ncbi:uncharacterized protein LOC123546708 [Mercenaria mercenaria]|uniref:uncharacterized protein LOC123546708 n=1 Tax=Mercenaria mercenaria TaxID=6596 RepID=UPI00234ECB7E|nr:uncharacterized protein LOC123546708 [Mercenaria mercenaria]
MAEKQGGSTKKGIDQITYPSWGGSGGVSAKPDAHENSMHMGSDEDREIFCDPCEIDEQKHLAERYCKNCAEFLCINCYNNHRKYRPTRHHILLDKHEMPTIKNVHIQKDVCTDHCTYHEDKVIEYYCSSCDQFGCSHCFILGHRNCSVAPIQDIVAGLEKSNEFKLFKDRLAKLKGQLRVNGTTHHSNRSAVDVLKGRAKKEICKQRNAISAFFDKLEKQVDSEIDRIRNEDTELMEDVAKKYKLFASEIQTKLSDFERKEELGQRCQLFVDMKTSGEYLQEMEDKISRISEENKIHRYELLMSEEILSIMENLKQISVLFKKYAVWRRKPIFGGKINMQAAGDRNKCNITGMCLLNRNHLFAADSNNLCVKLVDLEQFRTSKIVCIVPMPSWPWDISTVSDEQIAVTLPIVGQVCFLTQKGSQASRKFTSRTIDVGRECRGIEYSKGNLIVSFATDPGIVKILTVNGNVLHVFSTGQDGQQLFGRPYYLALGLDHNVIYVSDNEKHTVTSLDRYGKTVKDVCKIEDVRCPDGMAVDRTDSLFVCGSGNYNVNQLYSDLSQVQILLDHSNAEEAPQCITYCGATNMIFIGMQYKSFVNMFKLM